MTALDVKKWGYFQIILDLAQNDVDLSEYQRKFTQNARNGSKLHLNCAPQDSPPLLYGHFFHSRRRGLIRGGIGSPRNENLNLLVRIK
jgi:hypothetical protein